MNRLRPVAPVGVLVAALLLAAGCSKQVRETRGSYFYMQKIQPSGEVELNVNGVEIEISPDCRYEYEEELEIGASRWSATLDGRELTIDDGKLRIGDASYGSVVPGDHVRIAREGVFVGDERRGDAPPPPE